MKSLKFHWLLYHRFPIMSIFFQQFLYIIRYKRCYLFHKIFKKERHPELSLHPDTALLIFHTSARFSADFTLSSCELKSLTVLLKKLLYGFTAEHSPQFILNIFQFIMGVTRNAVLAVSGTFTPPVQAFNNRHI